MAYPYSPIKYLLVRIDPNRLKYGAEQGIFYVMSKNGGNQILGNVIKINKQPVEKKLLKMRNQKCFFSQLQIKQKVS